MAVRRSARLRSNTPSEVAEPAPTTVDIPPAVIEHDDSSNIPARTHTPIKSSIQKAPDCSNKALAVTETPSGSATRPTLSEMHPSKVQQSTAKKPDSGLILGFNPVKRDADGNILRETFVQDTPSKIKTSPSRQFGTPGYEFKFSYQESQLSDEAKKLMDSIREDTEKIKAQMAHDREKQAHSEGMAKILNRDRKIAKPKSKSGRFSDAHMAEFKKMDSIAGHASAFRAAPGRFRPVTQPAARSLKRTNYSACLDEVNEQPSPSPSPSKSPVKHPPTSVPVGTKRLRNSTNDDISTHRQLPADDSTSSRIGIRSRNVLSSSLMTPTKSSMMRKSASARQLKSSGIPSLAQSPFKVIQSPHTPRTDFNPRFNSQLPVLSGLKSILRRHQPLFSKDPVKIASGTHTAAPGFKSDMLLAGTFNDDEPRTPSPKKHVNFSASTKSPHDSSAEVSLSSTKSSIIQAHYESDVIYPTLPDLPRSESSPVKSFADKTETPFIRQGLISSAAVRSPSVARAPSVAHGARNRKRTREEAGDNADIENMPPTDITERDSKRIKISTSPTKDRTIHDTVKEQCTTPRQAFSCHARVPAPPKQRRPALSVSRLNMLATPKHRI